MTQTTPPPIPTLIPDSAPFSVEQRTWLNGFFAGLLSLDGGVNALSSEETAALMNDVMGTGVATARGPLDDGDDGQTPWHDPAMPIGDRMQLAESRPLRRRFMAAMGQQDCGQCGYNCEDYANAIVLKNEERLNLCVPGGKDTTRMLKTLYAEFCAKSMSICQVSFCEPGLLSLVRETNVASAGLSRVGVGEATASAAGVGAVAGALAAAGIAPNSA